MTVRVVLNKRVENFEIKGSYTAFEGESPDGMRRGGSYEVRVVTNFSFTKEKQEEVGYSYDLCVVRNSSRAGTWELTETEERFFKNFSFIATVLRNRGVAILSPAAYMPVRARSAEELVKLSFGGEIFPVEGGAKLFTAAQLLAHLGEEGEDSKQMIVARAIGNKNRHNREFNVDLVSITDDLYGEKKEITLRKVDLEGLLLSGEINEEDVKLALRNFASNPNRYRFYTDGLERFILDLPDELIKEVIARSEQTASNLDLFRTYCPERIDWSEAPSEEMLPSDLDLMIEYKKRAFRTAQRFLESCMANPEMERKIVDNAFDLALYPQFIAEGLKVCTTRDFLRSACRHFEERRSGKAGFDEISLLFDLAYEGLDKQDYEACLSLIPRLELRYFGEKERLAAFILRVGVKAGIEESELVRMLREEHTSGWRIDVHCSHLRKAYQELNFTPGLAWVKEEDARIEAEKQRVAREQAESNERVVRFVQNSSKLAVPIKTLSFREVVLPNGNEVGALKTDEQRILLIEGRRHDYLIDVERVKRFRNGVLHLDVLENDAGYVIGPKGSKIKETTARLNKRGCQLRMIKIHTYTADE